jgi:hypothetical protein
MPIGAEGIQLPIRADVIAPIQEKIVVARLGIAEPEVEPVETYFARIEDG